MVATFFSRLKVWIRLFQFCISPVVDLGHNNLPSATQNPGRNFSLGLHEFHIDPWSSVTHWFYTTHVSEDDYTAAQGNLY